MYEKHCRYCHARIGSSKGWHDNYCCDDHRLLFQDRQHLETIERLRREEMAEMGDRAESELAIHTFEPRRVRVAMLGGSDPGPITPPSGSQPGPGSGRSGGNSISRGMPPQVRVQPLVAPPLQPKASVEQGLAALASIAEPVSAPLEIPMGYGNASPVAPSTLGTAVRRTIHAEPQQKPERKNQALVNLIRGAKERIPTPELPAYLRPPVEPGMSTAFTHGNSARVRPVAEAAVTAPWDAKPAAPVKKARVQDNTPIPKFLQAQPAAPSEKWKSRGLQFSLVGLALSAAAAYYVFAGRIDQSPIPGTQSTSASHAAPAKSPAPSKSASRAH